MQALKIDQFYEYRYLSSVKWAPGGARAAFVVKECNAADNKYSSNIYLYEGGGTRRLTGMDEEAAFLWEDAFHLLFPAVRSADERRRAGAGEQFTAWYRLDVRGGEAVKAFEVPFRTAALTLLPDGGIAAEGMTDLRAPDLYRASEEEKRQFLAESREEADYEVLEQLPWWHNGGTYSYRDRSALFLRTREGGEFRRVTGPEMSVHNLVADGGRLYFTAEDCSSAVTDIKAGIYEYDTATQELRCILPPHQMIVMTLLCTPSGLVYGGAREKSEGLFFYMLDARSGESQVLDVCKSGLPELSKGLCTPGSSVGSDCRLGGGYTVRWHGGRLWLSATVGGRAPLFALDAAGKGECVADVDGSVDCFDISDRGEVLAVAMLGQRLQELYRLENGALIPVSDFNGAVLSERYVASPEHLAYTSQGHTLEGWVLKPLDYDPGKRYPAILDIHGGPATVYGSVFVHEMQYWAGQGYFVFFCNPVGSDGFGPAFASEIYGDYGGKDFRSIMDFTDAVLARYPQIDASRVAVTGGSYGGFMTNWIIGHTQRFACAATQRSISNWFTMEAISDTGAGMVSDDLQASLFGDHARLWAQSPLKYAEAFETPTLIIHSDCDYRCPIVEGYQMYHALVRKGTPARMVIFHGENHELSRSGKPRHRLRRLREITDWFSRYTRE